MDLMIVCPKCGAKVDVSKQMGKAIEDRMNQERTEIGKEVRQELAAQNKEQIRKAKVDAAKQARAQAETKHEAERKKSQNQLASKEKEIDRLQKQQEQKVKAMADQQTKRDVAKALADYDKSQREKLGKKDLVIKEYQDKLARAQNKAHELESKLSQGSPQAQGILAEEDLFRFLQSQLGSDRCHVEKRGQGKKGTDVIVHVHRNGERVGALIVDDKWANEWGRDWAEKVWGDMQTHDAEFAYIAANPSALPQEIRTAGFGVAPCRRAGVRVWVVDRSNPQLVLGILLDTVEKILKLAEIKEIYGATSKDVKQFQTYLSKGYETDIREKAKHMSVALKALSEIQKKVNSEHDKAWEALRDYWSTEERVHRQITGCFGRDTVKALPQIELDRHR